MKEFFQPNELCESQQERKGLYDECFDFDSCGIGLVANPTAKANAQIVSHGLEILKNLAHRSALGADGKTSDGAGLMVQIPDLFFRNEIKKEFDELILPEPGRYAVAQIFLSRAQNSAISGHTETSEGWMSSLKNLARRKGFSLLIRSVPVDSSVLGPLARQSEPWVVQVFFIPIETSFQFSIRVLYELRVSLEKELSSFGEMNQNFYICSLSNHTLVYKGLMRPSDLGLYYQDLKNPLFASQFAMVHSRFSTNTWPAWGLAQPFRSSCHNGEINTIRSNRKWMQARGCHLTEGRSDSYSFDEGLEQTLLSGRSLVQSLMTMVPDPWENDPFLPQEIRSFYEYHSIRMEPWDGPAAFCLTDGQKIVLSLDRNGLRPCRYQVLSDGTFVAGSEAGALPVLSGRIIKKGQLRPGQIIVIDIPSGFVDLSNDQKKKEALSHPFSLWVQREQKKSLRPIPLSLKAWDGEEGLWETLRRFGFHYDEVTHVILPMFLEKEEPLSSMGYDIPLPILSDRPLLLTDYFRQLFAQVTNPPMDSLREKSVMSLTTFLGARGDLSEIALDVKQRWRLSSPILGFSQLEHYVQDPSVALSPDILDITFDLSKENLASVVERVCWQACERVLQGCDVLILSDQKHTLSRAALPAVLVTSAIHQELIRRHLRLKTCLVIQSGEVRDSHQVACLLAFGADVIHPYLIEALALELQKESLISYSPETAFENYCQALDKGVYKILSKLGISTMQSYCGSQSFEVLGLSEDLVQSYFPGTPSRMGGLNLSTVTEEIRRRWLRNERETEKPERLADLSSSGEMHFRANGENHQWTPNSLVHLQTAARTGSFETYQKFSEEMNRNQRFTLRGHLRIRNLRPSIPLTEVESARDIVKRFTTGAMSLGALSSEAHETLARAMNRLGAKSNSGEGGEDPKRFGLQSNGENLNSAIKQIASGRFGVTTPYLVSAQEIQIKMAQGAKPGEGGQLAGAKIDAEIARLRCSTPGVTLISPPPHHDIYSIEDLAQLIFDLRCVNPGARLSVKLVAKAGVGTIAAGVVKAKAQKILISGDGGGTGAAPFSSIRHAGIPWEIGLSETHQTLKHNGLRDKVVLETDGQLRTGRDVAIAALLGAEEFGFSTAPLIVEGCLMMRKCHLNTCPVGVATQDPVLRQKFKGQAEHLINYFFFVAEELREIMAAMGVAKVSELVGRTDWLEWQAPDHWKAHTLDLSRLLYQEKDPSHFQVFEEIAPSFDEKNGFSEVDKISIFSVRNTDRSIGAWLAGESVKKRTNPRAHVSVSSHVEINLYGSAGQSFGAFLTEGVCLRLFGEANDYVGKSLSGGRLVICHDSRFLGPVSDSSLIGNTCLYGATSGELFVAGQAGERFAVRNSGALAVVEGVGNHGCEYMTGGLVIVLGDIGKNFAAGMSGGVVYLYDRKKISQNHCNQEMVFLDKMGDEDELQVFRILTRYQQETQSERASLLLSKWNFEKDFFIKVMPKEYQKFIKPKTLNARRSEVSF